MNSWKIVPLHDISLKITKGTTPTTIGRPFRTSGVNFIKAEALNGDSELDENGFSYIDEDTNQLLRRSVLQENDVLITIAGAKIGKCGYVKTKHLPANTNQAVGIVRLDIKKAVPRFVYYFFKNAKTYEHIQSLNAQAAQPNINLETLGNLKLCLPSYQTQDRIADILSAYDDLIENNRRRIQLLEKSARLLYKEWFVRLRFPGHARVKIKDGVPEGWVKKLLGEIAPLSYGKGLKEDDRVLGTYPVYGSSGVIGTHNKALVDGPAIIIGRKGNVGRVFMSNDDCYPIDTVYFIERPTNTLYLYYALLHTSFISTDVAVPGLNRDFAHSRKILIPNSKILSLFEDFISPLHKQIYVLQKHNQTLAQARDLLLPRLMNGEIAV